jgi:hypothetical protein
MSGIAPVCNTSGGNVTLAAAMVCWLAFAISGVLSQHEEELKLE